jgi:hypothetical protein
LRLSSEGLLVRLRTLACALFWLREHTPHARISGHRLAKVEAVSIREAGDGDVGGIAEIHSEA